VTAARALGRSGLSTPPLILGGNVFGWTIDEATGFAVLDAFVAHGGRMIDTADVYSAWVQGNSGGESEAMIGRWLKARGHRDVMVTTKVGMLAGEGGQGLAPARIAAACDASLRRLGVETIDLYLAHRDDAAVPQQDVAAAFDALVKEGKVRAIGASNFTADRLASAIAVQQAGGHARYEVIQNLYSLMDRADMESGLQRTAIDAGVAITTFSSLANGYLTGKYRRAEDVEGRTRGSRVTGYMTGKGPAVLAALDAIAAETGASLAAISLGWLAAQPGVAAPIASATSVAQVEELMASTTLVLTPEQIARLDAASAA
jgi:aryl-alcohol dehydrogenase-like predicted oxidoreductase